MSPADTCVLFHVPARGLPRRPLLDFARRLQREVARGRPFCVLITSDPELRRLNRRFRKKDYATDVLSFPTLEKNDELGEMAISWDRAKAQASEFGHHVRDEIRVLMLHGVLHLTGLDHETDQGEMAKAETRWRKRLELPTGLIERART